MESESQEGEEKKLLSPVQIGIQLVIGLGPLLLVGAIVAGIYLFRQWDELDVLHRSLIGCGGFAGLVAGFIYLIKIGLFIRYADAISVSKVPMQRRTEALLSGREDDLVAVELFGREKWMKPGMSDDFGFLQIDCPQRILRFEGHWTAGRCHLRR